MSASNHKINNNVPSKKLKITKNTTIATSSTSMITGNSTTRGINTSNGVGGKDNDDDDDDDFETIKEYLLKCPLVASVHDSPAIKAALEGIEKEQKRRIRDAKLRSKFLANATNSTSNSSNTNNINTNNININNINNNNNDRDEIVVVEKHEIAASSVILESNSNSSNDTDDMEWQDVQQQQKYEDALVPAVRAIGDSFTMEHLEESSSSTSTLEPCFLGRTLARACIDAIAAQQKQHQKQVEVSTPLAAIAVALHAALRSDVLGFACTGIPEDVTTNNIKNKGKSIGFAPPIRELFKTQFLPRGWDDDTSNSNTISISISSHNNNGNIRSFLHSPPPLRYRKTDTGAVVLTVEGHPSGDDDKDQVVATECRVTFVPTNSKDENENSSASHHTTSSCLRFPLSEHINLDSWNAAAAAARKTTNKSTNPKTEPNYQHKIAPSLHYKNLAGLLSKFCRAFDLGAVHDEKAIGSRNNSSTDGAMKRTKISGNSNSYNNNSKMEVQGGVFVAEHHPATAASRNTTTAGYSVPTTPDQAFPPNPPGVAAVAAAARRSNEYAPPHRGDFAGDLLPAPSSGLQDPRFAGRVGGGRMGGNLMGPNHPMFSPGSVGVGGHGQFPGMGGIPIGGPGTMQPRFDPLLPPGIGGGNDFPPAPGSLAAANRRRTVPGEPDPDHLPPPNSLGNNMFM